MAIVKKGPTKREINAMETRNRIFTVALQLFAKHGYEKVTVDDITQFAGVSKGNFYTHFESKDAVLVEQFQRIDEYYLASFRQAPTDLMTEERIMLLFRAMSEYCEDICGVSVMKVVYANQIGLGERARILLNRDRMFYTLLRGVVSDGCAEGYFEEGLAEEEIVEMLAAASRSVLYEWCLRDGEESLKESSRRFAERYLRCVKA